MKALNSRLRAFSRPSDQTVDQGMETGRMVVVNRVAEFVDDHIVAQVLRKSHQKEAQRDVVAPRATPPLRARGADRKFFALQARRLRQPPDAARQVGFRRTAQLLDAGFPLLGRQLRRQGCPLAGEPSRAAPTIPLFAPKIQSPFLRHPQGNESRTAPVARTEIEMRRARTVCERVTSPSRGCT